MVDISRFVEDGVGILSPTVVETFTAYTDGFNINRGNYVPMTKTLLGSDILTPYDISKYDYVICNRLISETHQDYYNLDGFYPSGVNPSTGKLTFIGYADGNNDARVLTMMLEFTGIKI